MEVAPGITKHTVVVCVDKRERGVGIQALLTKAGYRVVMALSLYDALKFVAQEMPHLVITEALLSDGTAGTLYDRLKQHPTLKKTPILVYVLKKTREELNPLAGRQFSGFFLGKLVPATFLKKVQEVVQAKSPISPHFVPVTSLPGIKSEMTISIEASVMGRTGDQLVSRSATEVDPAASMLCIPQSDTMGPALLRMASNLQKGDDVFNLFPINRIVGKGRKWVLSLPEVDLNNSGGQDPQGRKVLFYDPNGQRYGGFQEIMAGYDIELVHAKSLAMAASLLKRDPEGYGCVYLHELLGDASGIEWKKVYGGLSASARPPMIVGTTSMSARSTGAIRYIKRPFGMGLFVEMIEAAFQRADGIAAAAGSKSQNANNGVPVNYQAPAKLVGLDETGGIMQVRFPVLPGSRLAIDHDFLGQAWEGNKIVQVTSSGPLKSKPEIYQARFEAVGAGMSKVKYWERVSKHIESQLTAAEPQAESA